MGTDSEETLSGWMVLPYSPHTQASNPILYNRAYLDLISKPFRDSLYRVFGVSSIHAGDKKRPAYLKFCPLNIEVNSINPHFPAQSQLDFLQ